MIPQLVVDPVVKVDIGFACATRHADFYYGVDSARVLH